MKNYCCFKTVIEKLRIGVVCSTYLTNVQIFTNIYNTYKGTEIEININFEKNVCIVLAIVKEQNLEPVTSATVGDKIGKHVREMRFSRPL